MKRLPLSFAAKIPAWMRQVEEFPKCQIFGAKSGDLADGTAIAAEGLYNYRLTKKSYHPDYSVEKPNAPLTAFAYLWRRFGPPIHGTDDHKCLVRYILGTPHKEVWLDVDLGACYLQLSIGYMATKSLLDRLNAPWFRWTAREQQWLKKNKGITNPYAELDAKTQKEVIAAVGRCPRPPLGYDWRLGPPVMRAANQALLAALRELLRPVYVRDVAINILGRCDDSDHAAPRSEFAGYGIDLIHHRKMIANMEKRK